MASLTDNITTIAGTAGALYIADRVISRTQRKSKSSKVYRLYSKHRTKSTANATAKILRNKGYLASVRKESSGYSMWKR